MPKRKPQFQREIRQLMYGFGDQQQPLQETVDIMDELLEWFIKDLADEALKHSTRVKTNDFLNALKDDPKKLARAHELLTLDKELKLARAAFDVQEMTKGMLDDSKQ
ncbi:transcription initiation factor IID, 18kDa subunit [Gorgonomyces haynaldii]|nr:transcription initiation factor IID, 18kDa subunit [Gorgonomyces haynaldii]